tara:strand:- start:82830 stop:83741 length:912 start_codon:yes stop_codon:yes gene_type:complete
MLKIGVRRKKLFKNPSQLEIGLERPKERDRNHHLGGRSFYFFDFDDNVAYLTTPIVIFQKDTGIEKFLSSGEWAKHHLSIGKEGLFENYFIDYNDERGSFRYFRDKQFNLFEKITRKKQTFLEDIEKVLQKEDLAWKAPSWNCFYHATYNQRPTSVITARGHNSLTIEQGIDVLVRNGHLPHEPNYLSIYPVTNPNIRHQLGDKELNMSVADLKRSAIRQSVEKAIEQYGHNPHHRFGMSDDDPKNVELITEEMKELKRNYPEMSFFVIQTFEDRYVKTEITHKTQRVKRKKSVSNNQQLSFI